VFEEAARGDRARQQRPARQRRSGTNPTRRQTPQRLLAHAKPPCICVAKPWRLHKPFCLADML